MEHSCYSHIKINDYVRITSTDEVRDILIKVLTNDRDSSALRTVDQIVYKGLPAANPEKTRTFRRNDFRTHTFTVMTEDKNPEYFL